MKIVFIGTPEFGAIILEKLCKSEFKPSLVITAPDKPVGRKQVITPPPVKISAQKYNIPVEQPDKIRNLKLEIRNLKPDLGIVAAYGQILPKEILDMLKFGCLNVHPSLLPKYRGPTPMRFTILNGDKKTGVTIILIDEKIDHGPILAQGEWEISNPKITHPRLSKELAEVAAKLLIETIPKWLKGEIKPKTQDESQVTYTKILTREDGRIDWALSARQIERQIRAFDPWPGAFTLMDSKKIKILEAEILEQTKVGPFGLPGKTFLAPNDKIAVQTGKDYLIITKLQPEGKKPMASEELLRGNSDFVGTILK